jgi:hypothetical protein
MQLEDFHHVVIRKLAILVLVNRIECVPSLDYIYAALDWISMSLRRMVGVEYHTISAIANLFPTEVTLTLALSPTFPFLTNITKPCIRATPSPLSLLSVT